MKVFENIFGQVVEKSFDLVLCVWLRARGSNEIQRFEQIFGLRSKCLDKELPPLSMLYVMQKKIFAEREKA